AERRAEVREDALEDLLRERPLRTVEQVVDRAQLSREHEDRALRTDEAPRRALRGRAGAILGCLLQLGQDEVQVRLDPVETLLERDAVDLRDQLVLPARQELRDDEAEDEERG